ncbi:hypothetical protein C2S53_005150 [Perilla frutescens var. hirtella]|uniref:Cystatin domain-containing protein n=1 Tax=Perilla frutescens var. hirtella TaxID=608512 RepID=A0AAD4PER5_PERFH|nr:hypothetical protein C2S53_005150 [Perilla frutescens var. hirtella]
MEGLLFDQTAYSEYMDDLNYSQVLSLSLSLSYYCIYEDVYGFYVTPPKDGSLIRGGIRRVGEDSGERYLKAKCAAEFAVAEHNKKAGKEGFLKFDRIVNLNVEPSAGAVYYITVAVVEADGETYKLALNNCCVAIHNLMPWMDENYLYYKCFFANPQVVGVEAVGSEEKKVSRAYVWLRNSAQVEGIVNKYRGRKMPHSNIFFTFDLTTH